MKDKYNLTMEENIFVAKRNIIDIIWKSSRLEGIAVTFPDTEAIYNGQNISSLKVDEVVAINNLKHAWQFMLDTIPHPMNYHYLCKLHQYVGTGLVFKPGYMRTVPVSIGGTEWKPELPIEQKVKEDIQEIMHIDNTTDRALTFALYCMRSQIFLDGNKRTAMLAANQILISQGAGVLVIPINIQPEFTRILVEYYESGKMETVKRFLYDNCIDGIAFSHEHIEQFDMIKEEIIRYEYLPSSTLIENIQNLYNKKGRTISLEEISLLNRTESSEQEDIKNIINEIAEECRKQEKLRTKDLEQRVPKASAELEH